MLPASHPVCHICSVVGGEKQGVCFCVFLHEYFCALHMLLCDCEVPDLDVVELCVVTTVQPCKTETFSPGVSIISLRLQKQKGAAAGPGGRS